jgi:amino acid transporter
LPAELSAAAVLINYWNKEVNNAVWITMCLIVVVIINALGAGAYGEAEFIFASIKVRIVSPVFPVTLIKKTVPNLFIPTHRFLLL